MLRPAIAGVMSLLICATGATAAPPLAPPAGVVRLGPMAGTFAIDGVSKPLAAVDAPFEVELPTRTPGVLHVAAGLVPPATDAAVCDVRRVDGASRAPLASLRLDQTTTWAEASIALEHGGGSLRFECRPAGATMPRFTWARPILVPGRPGGARREAPLVVVLSLDTLRADHVEGFGSPPRATPELGRIAAEGLRFVDATAQGTWTVPSHFGLFFSRLYGLPLGDHRLVGLAEALGDRGYATAAFTAGGFVSASFGFGQGFDHYVEHDSAYRFGGSDLLALPELLQMVDAYIDRYAGAALFLFVHTYAVHQQTLDEVEWSARYAADFGPLQIGRKRVIEARRQYRRLVRRTDRALRPLFARLRRESATRPVVAVVLSDHGEAFGEHDNFRHGDDTPAVTLHDEIARVPLIVWAPGLVAPGTSRRPTMLLDVAPSLLEAADARVPPSMVGTSLAHSWTRGPAEHTSGGGAVTRGARGWMLRTAARKLIVETGALELYDLRHDPGERRNVAGRYPRAVAHLQRRLSRRVGDLGGLRYAPGEVVPGCPLCASGDLLSFFELVTAAQHKGMQSIQVNQETRDRLEALGYVDF